MKEIYLDNDDLPAAVQDVSDPVVMEREDLEELRSSDDDATSEELEELRDSISELSDIREEKQELEQKIEELEEEIEELEELDAEVEDVKRMHAEDVADASPFSVEELMEFDVDVLREKADDVDSFSEEEEELEDDPKGGNADEEELTDEPDTDTSDEEIEDLEAQLEWYEERGWATNAEEVRAELEELRGD